MTDTMEQMFTSQMQNKSIKGHLNSKCDNYTYWPDTNETEEKLSLTLVHTDSCPVLGRGLTAAG